MGNHSKQDQGTHKQMNDYEKLKLLRVKENQERLKELGVTSIAKSLTSLAQSKKTKKCKDKSSRNEKDVDYSGDGERYYCEEINTSARVPTKQHRPQYIAPMSMIRYANFAKKKRVIPPNVSSMTTADVILKKKESTKQSGAIKHNLTNPNSSGPRRKLFLVDQDNDEDDNPTSQDMNKEQDDAEYEGTDGAEYEDEIVDNGLDNEDEELMVEQHERPRANETAMELDGAEYEDEDRMIVDDELDNEDEELVLEQPEGLGVNETGERKIKRRARGPTRMKKIWGESEIIKVQFNEFGQPIDKEKTSQLTHFMGAVARSGKYCPIYKPWPKVSDTKKEALLDLLKTKFDIPSTAHDWIKKSFGKKVRNWRARLKEYHDPSLTLREQIKSKPKRVHKSQWKKLVKFWNRDSSKKLSEKNKVNRTKKKMVQVTGKKSYARVREELKTSSGCEPSRMEMFRACFSKDGITKTKEVKSAIELMEEKTLQLPKGSIDKPGPEDTFSKVIKGNDQTGIARMYGLGVRASDVWGVNSSRAACLKENIDLKIRNEQLEAKVAQLEGKEPERERLSEVGINDSSVPLQVGAEVYLRNILSSTEIVAKGRIKSLDPNEHVGSEEIGPGWCEVNIQVPIKRCARLVRPFDLHVTVEDVVGATTAWPCTFVSVVPLDDA